MIKKSVHIALVLLLLASTTGVAVAQHFCGESLRFSELTVGLATSSCCEDVDSMAMDCCHNDVQYNFVDDAFTQVAAAHTATLEYMNTLLTETVYSVEDRVVLSFNNYRFTRDNTSLHGSTISIPVLHQAFLI
jgi:hypothetical protein